MTTTELPLQSAEATATRSRPYLDLLLISFLILFFELACIRFFGSTVVFLTFFTNIVLMACFLGMSIGCITATRKRNFIEMVLPLTFLSAALALATFVVYKTHGRVMIDVGNQSSPQLIYFGTEYRPKDPSTFVIPIEVVAGLFFVLIALIFVGLGQVMGRAFDAIPSRIGAYTANVLGSLLGIVGFFAASWFRTSPHTWFLICIALTLYFLPRWSALQIVSQIGAMFVIAMVSYGIVESGQLFWSPYYKIRYVAQAGGIDTNNISHQQMINVLTAGPAYMMPHLLNRDAGGKPFDNVMIIGAGSGNDVAAALANGAGHIDAVEIDPVINQRGVEDHPNHPFDNPRVKVWYDDGRSFLHKDHGPYDLEVYALVDSLVLHSGFSSLRLENFLFTEQAFRDVKARLKPGGVFAMYNYYRQGWVVARLATMAKNVFGMDPLIISLPYQETITPADNQANHITFLLVGLSDAGSDKNSTIENIRSRFGSSPSPGNPGEGRGEGALAKSATEPSPPPSPGVPGGGVRFFALNQNPTENQNINGFDFVPPALPSGASLNPWQKIAPARVDTAGVNLWPTDNWPFLYLKSRAIPFKPNQMGIYVIGGLSIVLMVIFTWPIWFNRGGPRVLPSGQMFFLGAGFMLLETKGVVHMALLFGSTWIVNSVVFFAILVMILLANLFVITFKPKTLLIFYGLLIAALLVNTLVPMDKFLALSGVARTLVSSCVIFVPIFFAGVIFAARFRDSSHPDIDLGSNIAGVILGGLTENLSMILGFNYLLAVAIGFYALSWALQRRRPVEGAAV